MKCVRNKKTGGVLRLPDEEAHERVKTNPDWGYIPRSEYFKATEESATKS